MIGEIRSIIVPYYDRALNKMKLKSRPALIVAIADASDYVVLPISKISIKRNIDPVFDIMIDPSIYTNTNLRVVSYVRTHKQTTVNHAEIGGRISSLKDDYPDLYLLILNKRDEFSRMITLNAV